MNKIITLLDNAFITVDKFLDRILPNIWDIHIWKSITITRTTQKRSMFSLGFITALGLLWNMGTVFAGPWHGIEGAENLGTIASVVWAQFTNPADVDSSSIGKSYPGSIASDAYGSIFSFREGIVSQLHVNLGDQVKKWQKVATIALSSKTPEIIAMLAEQKVMIAVAEGMIEGKRRVVDYLNAQSWTIVQDVFVQKRKSVDISIDTQRQQLQTKIDFLKIQTNPKLETISKSLQWSIQSAVAALAKVFAKGETTYQSFEIEFRNNIFWWARDSSQRQIFIWLMQQVLSKYPNLTTLSETEMFELGELTEKTIKQWVKLLSFSITTADYSTEQFTDDTKDLIDAYSDPEMWITAVVSMYREISSENKQELTLMSKELDLLDAEKNSQLAELGGDQSMKWLDIQMLIIDAETDVITAQSELQARKNALQEITDITKSTIVTAPFNGIISRKNVVLGQSIDMATPIFDIVWTHADAKIFVRFEIPILEYRKVKVWQELRINLPGEETSYLWNISRIAQSVDKHSQTVTIEWGFRNESPYPIGTNIRVSTQWLSGVTGIQIPSTAIGQDDDGKSWVYKVLKNKTLKKRYVETAYTDGDITYLNGWLTAADTIVTEIVGWSWTWSWVDWQDVSPLLTDTKDVMKNPMSDGH